MRQVPGAQRAGPRHLLAHALVPGAPVYLDEAGARRAEGRAATHCLSSPSWRTQPANLSAAVHRRTCALRAFPNKCKFTQTYVMPGEAWGSGHRTAQDRGKRSREARAGRRAGAAHRMHVSTPSSSSTSASTAAARCAVVCASANAICAARPPVRPLRRDARGRPSAPAKAETTCTSLRSSPRPRRLHMGVPPAAATFVWTTRGAREVAGRARWRRATTPLAAHGPLQQRRPCQGYARQQRRKTPPIGLVNLGSGKVTLPTRLQILSTKLCCSAARAPHGERVRKRLPPARRRRRRRSWHCADAAAARQAQADGEQHAQRGQRHARLAEDRAHRVGRGPGQRGGRLARRARIQHRCQPVAAWQHAHLRRGRCQAAARPLGSGPSGGAHRMA